MIFWIARNRWSLTRRRTGCTHKRRCCFIYWVVPEHRRVISRYTSPLPLVKVSYLIPMKIGTEKRSDEEPVGLVDIDAVLFGQSLVKGKGKQGIGLHEERVRGCED